MAFDVNTLTNENIAARALRDPDFREGLLAAAAICRANDRGAHPCPSGMAAVYIERQAAGQLP